MLPEGPIDAQELEERILTALRAWTDWHREFAPDSPFEQGMLFIEPLTQGELSLRERVVVVDARRNTHGDNLTEGRLLFEDENAQHWVQLTPYPISLNVPRQQQELAEMATRFLQHLSQKGQYNSGLPLRIGFIEAPSHHRSPLYELLFQTAPAPQPNGPGNRVFAFLFLGALNGT